MKRHTKTAALLMSAVMLSVSAPVSASVTYKSESDFCYDPTSAFSFPFELAEPDSWEYRILDGIDGVCEGPCIELLKYKKYDDTIVIPDEIDGIPVVSLGNDILSNLVGAFYTTLYIPDSVKVSDPEFIKPYSANAIVSEAGDSYVFCGHSYGVSTNMSLVLCADREHIVIPETFAGQPVSSVEYSILCCCDEVITLELPDSIECMAANTFGECSSLKKLRLPENITTLPSECLCYLPSLEEVDFPEELLFIPADALPETIRFDYPADKVFDNISPVYYSGDGVYVFDYNTNWCYKLKASDKGGVAVLTYAPGMETPPSTYLGYPVELELSDVPPSGAPVLTITKDLTSFRLPYDINPETIRKLNIYSERITISGPCFSDSKIESLDFPGSVYIEGSMFRNCRYLERLRFSGSGSVIHLGYLSFGDNKKLSQLVFPESVHFLTIENDAFYNTGLKELVLPEGQVDIADSAFSCCPELESVTVNDNATIRKKAFYNCPSLSEVTFKGKSELEENVFKDCENLSNINLDLSEDINGGAFTSCINLTSINGKPIAASDGTINKEFLSFIEKNFSASDDNGIINSYIRYRVKKIIDEKITEDMNDLEKVKSLHDALCGIIEFDETKSLDPKNHVDVSVFLNDTSVCDGYARAMNLLLHEAGIRSCYVYNNDHAWVIADIGGHYFHVDPTWDDGDTIIYDWFMKADDQIISDPDHSTWAIRVPSSLHSFQCETLPVCNEHMGDVNNDGIVDGRDASAILSGYAVLSVGDESDLDPVLADFDFSGRIDALDASLVLTEYARNSLDTRK